MKEKSNNLKNIRKEHGLTVKEVVDGTGIPMRTYQNYEYMEREIGAGALQKLADFYGVSTDYLLGRSEASPHGNSPILSAKQKEKIALQKWLSLNDEKRQAVLDVMTSILEAYEIADKQAAEQEKKPSLFVFRRCSEHRVSAGIGYDLNDPDAWRDITVIDTPEAHQADFVVQIDGDSMEPEYHDGDYVYVKINPDVSIGKVGIFQDVDKGYIKMRGKDRLISLNKDYNDIPLTEEMKCIGMVIGVVELPEA